MNEAVLSIRNLSKTLGGKEIIRDISFDAYGGEVFGFLGPNGAGKTTTIKIIAGLLTLDEGSISIAGFDMKKDFEKAMANVGGIVENPEFYKYMTGLDNLRQYAAIREGATEERIAEVVREVGLEKRIGDKVGKYSLGMRQRLGVAQAMMHRPRLLILDEPTNGLDPAGIKELRDILKGLAHKEGVAVFVSSHIMSEMELMCDRVGVIAGGELRSVTTVQELTASVSADSVDYSIRTGDPERAAEAVESMGYHCADDGDGLIRVTVPASTENEAIAAVNAGIVSAGITLYAVSRKNVRKLEDVFIELTEEGGGQIE